MYDFVCESEVRPYRSFCSNTLVDLRDYLKDHYDIITQPVLVGSGARNMVMRDGNGPFDLDYNLQIISMPNKYWDDLFELKNTVLTSLNKIVGKTWFSDGHDSTAVITSFLCLENTPNVKFKFDVAIIAKNERGDYCRLIHDKRYFRRYVWCEVPSSKDVRKKADKLKKLGYWSDVREVYKKLKNHYLSIQDNSHPSFTVYVEAVNRVYDRI